LSQKRAAERAEIERAKQTLLQKAQVKERERTRRKEARDSIIANVEKAKNAVARSEGKMVRRVVSEVIDLEDEDDFDNAYDADVDNDQKASRSRSRRPAAAVAAVAAATPALSRGRGPRSTVGRTGGTPEEKRVRGLREAQITRDKRGMAPGGDGSSSSSSSDEGKAGGGGGGGGGAVSGRRRRARPPAESLNDQIKRLLEDSGTKKGLLSSTAVNRHDAESWWPFIQKEFIGPLYDIKFKKCVECLIQWPDLSVDHEGVCNRCSATKRQGII
jgi:hypothetical protein